MNEKKDVIVFGDGHHISFAYFQCYLLRENISLTLVLGPSSSAKHSLNDENSTLAKHRDTREL